MKLSLATPSLLFPTISPLLPAYTIHFIALGKRIRRLHDIYSKEKSELILKQIKLIRDLHVIGILSILVCILSMFLFFANLIRLAKYFFATSLIFLMIAFGLESGK